MQNQKDKQILFRKQSKAVTQTEDVHRMHGSRQTVMTLLRSRERTSGFSQDLMGYFPRLYKIIFISLEFDLSKIPLFL